MKNISKNKNFIKGNNNNVDNSIKIDLNKNTIKFDKVEVANKELSNYEKKIRKISFITSIIGLVTVLVDFLLKLMLNRTTFLKVDFFFILIGIFMFIFGLVVYTKYIVFLRYKKHNSISPGEWTELKDDIVFSYELIGKCKLCGGKISIRKASCELPGGEKIIRNIGVCENSNKFTKH